VLGALGLWVCVVAPLIQGGWEMLGSFWSAYFSFALAVIIVVGLVTAFRNGPVEFIATVVVGGALVWGYYAGTLRSWTRIVTDVGGATLAAAATPLVMRWLRLPTTARGNLETAIWGVVAWIFVSALSTSWLWWKPLPNDPARFATLGVSKSIVPEDARTWADLRIGLALSGGGYRAAVFHAGVLQALEDLGARISNLSTVSGGSIIGAYYAIGGDPATFARAMADGRFDVKRELMFVHNTLRLPLPMQVPGVGVQLLPFANFDRLDVQRDLLDHTLFRGARLHASVGGRDPDVGQPHLMIAVTDLTYGLQLGLLADGFVRLGEGASSWTAYRNAAQEVDVDLDLADRVAISGAFPMAFPPRRLRVRVTPVGASGTGWRDLLLVDGGLRDNTGLNLLRAAEALAWRAGQDPAGADYQLPAEWDLDAILVSDGGAIRTVLDKPESGIGLLPRAFDVAGIQADTRPLSTDPCVAAMEVPVAFSPMMQHLPLDARFNMKRNDESIAAPHEEWRANLADPVLYPPEILKRLSGLWPDQEDRRTKGIEEFLGRLGTHGVRGRDWSAAVHQAERSGAEKSGTIPRSAS